VASIETRAEWPCRPSLGTLRRGLANSWPMRGVSLSGAILVAGGRQDGWVWSASARLGPGISRRPPPCSGGRGATARRSISAGADSAPPSPPPEPPRPTTARSAGRRRPARGELHDLGPDLGARRDLPRPACRDSGPAVVGDPRSDRRILPAGFRGRGLTPAPRASGGPSRTPWPSSLSHRYAGRRLPLAVAR
jgi:hypothetical protein